MAVIERSARELAVSADRLYAEYNQIHPFREGNGRTGTLLLHTVAALCGRSLDLTGVTRDEWYSASRDSRPFRRGSAAGGINPRPSCRCSPARCANGLHSPDTEV
ncbi:MAG TPA: Fic family protein [Mycobacterium sp.]|nr:Fic family protein [Mycobacterium sp.]